MKTLMRWDDKYNTGNFVIDHQHRHLVQLIYELEEVCQHNDLKPALLETILEEVTNYTVYHFQTEEKIMEQVNYSALEEHKLLHNDFVNKLNLFKIETQKGTAYIDRIFCDFLKDWLIGHIITEDPKFMSEMSSGQGAV